MTSASRILHSNTLLCILLGAKDVFEERKSHTPLYLPNSIMSFEGFSTKISIPSFFPIDAPCSKPSALPLLSRLKDKKIPVTLSQRHSPYPL